MGIPIDFTRMTFTDLIPMSLQTLTDGGTTAVFNYLNPSLASNITTSDFQQINDQLDKVEWEFETLTNPVISLLVNPQNVNVDKKIIFNKIQTKGGFVVQFWGHDLPTISVKSQTGYFAINKEALRAFQLLKRHVYEKRFSTRQSFKGMPIVTMIWNSEVFEGFFNDFKYSLDATKPYIINYDFVFTVTNVLTIPIISQVVGIGGSIAGVFGSNLGSSLQESNGVQRESGWGAPVG